MITDDPYTLRWRNYRRMNWAASLWLVLGIPGATVLVVLLKLLLLADAAVVGALALAGIWIVGFFVLGFRIARFRCPRCEQRYFSHSELYFGAGRHCGSCGLKLYGSQQDNV